MTLNTILLAFGPPLLAPAAVSPSAQDVLAIQVGRAETVSHGALEHAVILIEGGKIVTIGEDLPIERGIPVLDRDPEWTALPGLVNCYSRVGMDSRGSSDSKPMQLASGELYPGHPDYAELLAAGVTTLGLYAPGNGIPGQTVVVRPHGDAKEAMILRDNAYLKILMRANAATKKMIRDGFQKADKHLEKEKKAREKWEKDKEKWEKDQKKKKDDEKKEEKKEEKKNEGEAAGGDEKEEPKEFPAFEAPEPDDEAKAFLALRAGELSALASISSAAEYLHYVDAIGKEEFRWDLRLPVTRESDLFYLAREIGVLGRRIVMEPTLSLHPNTMRQRNLPAELQRAGAKLVLIPRDDSVRGHEDWLRNTGEIVATGLAREAALRALTLEPAELLGLGQRLGSLDKGKDANIIFLNGDPFEPGTRVEAVMLDGRIVSGEVDQ